MDAPRHEWTRHCAVCGAVLVDDWCECNTDDDDDDETEPHVTTDACRSNGCRACE